MDVSVITVTWNSEKLIAEQVRSVKEACKISTFEQIIVDNASTDASTALITKQFPEVKLIKADTNLGFSAANNLAAAKSVGDYLLFLNPDTRLNPGSLDTVLAWMRQHPEVGLASCKLVDEYGSLNADAQPRHYPGLFDQLALILKIPHIFPSVLNRYLFKDFNPELEQKVDSVRGSFMLMPRIVYQKLGWAFDPRYFIWFEDVDTCREVKKLGYQVMHTPIISCVDFIGQSFKQRSTIWKQKQFTRSMLTYFQKWEPWYIWMWIAAARPVGVLLVVFHDYIEPRISKS